MKAAVLDQIGKPLRVREIAFTGSHPKLSEGHAIVQMLVAGICGAQIQEIDGIKGNPSHCPHLLGHEGCGRNVNTGEKVIVHWRKGIGLDPDPPVFGELTKIKAGPCTTFSQFTVVSENRVTPIPDDVPNDFACLLGCCLSTALATVENIAKIKPGERVLIIGAGGLGLAMILAARVAGASQITCSDKWESKKDLALNMGATFFLPAWWQGDYARMLADPAGMENPVKEYYYDVIINTATEVRTYDYLLDKGGRYISMLGPDKNSEGGNFNPTTDIPRYIQMWRDGLLDGWENIITHRIKLEQINEGIAMMRQGKTGRVMIDFT